MTICGEKLRNILISIHNKFEANQAYILEDITLKRNLIHVKILKWPPFEQKSVKHDQNLINPWPG